MLLLPLLSPQPLFLQDLASPSPSQTQKVLAYIPQTLSNIVILSLSTNAKSIHFSNYNEFFNLVDWLCPLAIVKVKPCLSLNWEELEALSRGRSPSLPSSIIILCIMAHAYMTSTISEVLLHLQGCVIIDHLACITLKHLSTFFHTNSCEVEKLLSFWSSRSWIL